MMTATLNPDKSAWLQGVCRVFDQQPLYVHCDYRQQKIAIAFPKVTLPSAARTHTLLNIYNQYLCTGKICSSKTKTNGCYYGREVVPGKGVVCERRALDGRTMRKEWFPSCFLNFPNPPPVDNTFVVAPQAVLRNGCMAPPGDGTVAPTSVGP